MSWNEIVLKVRYMKEYLPFTTHRYRPIVSNIDTFNAFRHRSVETKLLFECTNMLGASRIDYPFFHLCHQVCLAHHCHNDLFGLHHICLIWSWAFVVVLIVVEVALCPTFLLWNFPFPLKSCLLLCCGGLEDPSSTILALEVKFLNFINFFRHPICFFNLNINNNLLKI